MRNSYSMAFAVFFTSILLATAYADQCQITLTNRCIKAYQKDLKATSESYKDRCFRVQKLVTCLATEPECGGELIGKFRYWMLQMTIMDKILGTCPYMNNTALRSSVQQSGVGKTRGYLDDVDYNTADDCALKVHKECLRYYLSLLIKNQMLCNDADKLTKCYALYSKSIDCKAKIIQRYASTVEDVAHKVVELVQSHLYSLCESAALD